VAEDGKQPRRIRKVETVREKAEKTTAAQDKPRRLSKTTRVAGTPLRATGRGLKKAGQVKPFRILGFIIVPPYIRNSWKELRQVTWPDGKESRRLTLAVIIFAVIFGAFVAVLDLGLDKVFKQVLLK
jgi:preprotein translocase SecE subunit